MESYRMEVILAIFFYIFPCLQGILPQEYMDYFLLFVRSTHMLLRSEIIEAEIYRCEEDFKVSGANQAHVRRSFYNF